VSEGERIQLVVSIGRDKLVMPKLLVLTVRRTCT
jgi:beta-lactam-binding protein with PASTA domain